MSKDLVETSLPGYKHGPFMLEAGLQLAEFLNTISFNNQDIEVVSTLVGCTCGQRLKTEDGYDWFSTILFKANGIDAVILIPWGQDWEKKDGDKADRLLAFYLKESPKDVEKTVCAFGDRVRELLLVFKGYAAGRRLLVSAR